MLKLSAKGSFLFFLPLVTAAGLLSRPACCQTDATEQYIAKYTPIAEQEMERTGVPAAISLAQGILESQSGTGWLVEHSHNHFGIKCKSGWTGPVVYHDDDKRHECFRVYMTDDSSWRDHSDFLKNTPRYSFLFYLDPLDYKAWAYGLKQAGYATRKDYPEQLIGLIERYNLEQYSRIALAEMKKDGGGDFAAMLQKKTDMDAKRQGSGAADGSARSFAPASPGSYPAHVFRINGLDVLYLPQGTDLISVAAARGVRLSRLVSYNELGSDVLQENMLVYLEKKKKSGADPTHVLASGETLHEVAQQEGIRLKWLLKRNGLSRGEAPPQGTVLYLQGYKPSYAAKERRGFFSRLAGLFSAKEAETATTAGDARQGAAEGGTAALSPAFGQAEKSRPETATGEAISTYTVRRGDTLYGIARRYGVTVGQIQAWNKLQGTTIGVGQELIVKK
jgi:LysM repeat protein